MEVILLENVEQLGHTGDIVKVKDGYARNFLVPRNFAVVCTKQNRKLIEEKKKYLALKKEKEKAKYIKIAEKIASISCTIPVKTGEEDKLFGSVTNADIQKALAGEGIDLDKRRILLPEPIKTLGVYNVPIELYSNVKPELKVWVVKE